MAIEISEATTGDRSEWDSYVDRAPHATPFHQYAVLELLADEAEARIHPLIGYKGDEPVGLLPLFEVEFGPFSGLQSPPLGKELMYLGPVRLNFEKVKRRKAEKDHRRFVDACLDWIQSTVDPDVIDLRCCDRYIDVRPYLWSDFGASPQYIYVVDVRSGTDELFDDLTKETRRRIRNTEDEAYEIVEGGVGATRTITRQVRDRYEEQGRSYGLSPAFMTELHERLPDDQLHPYCLRTDGEVVSGLFTLEFGDTLHVWQGGVRTDVDLPVTELLYWHVIERAASLELDRVDLTTAMIPSLADFKAKFGPESRPIFTLRRRSPAWQVAEFGYKHFPKSGRDIVLSRLT